MAICSFQKFSKIPCRLIFWNTLCTSGLTGYAEPVNCEEFLNPLATYPSLRLCRHRRQSIRVWEGKSFKCYKLLEYLPPTWKRVPGKDLMHLAVDPATVSHHQACQQLNKHIML